MSEFISPLRFKDKPKLQLALRPPGFWRRLLWRLFGRCKHTLFAVDHVSGHPGRSCIRKGGHDGKHKSFDDTEW